MASLTRIDVWPGASRVRDGQLAVRALPADPGRVRLALIATEALLLADDHVRIEVRVDGPVVLEVVETTGTVAYDMRGGSARWDIDIEVTDGAGLEWAGEPFVVSAGACVERTTDVRVSEGSFAILRETVVLGRSGQAGGSLRTSTRATYAGDVALAEDLDLGPDVRGGAAIMGGRRCLDTLTTLGHRLADAPGVMQLEACGSVWRWLGEDLHTTPVTLPAPDEDEPARDERPARR